MKGSLQIMKVFGIRIAVHWTFAILIGWVLFSGKNSIESWWSVAFVMTIFVCVVLHELGHALAAKYFGIGTSDITLLPIGGVARIERMPEKPVQELVIAVAGPLVNVVLAFLLFFLVRNDLNSGLTDALAAVNGHNFFVNLFLVNISLAVFNLIPAFPMDGGRVLRALLSFRMNRLAATKVAVWIAQALAMGFIIFGILSNQHLQTSPTLLLISLFVFFGAQSELRTVTFRSILGGHQVSEVTMRDFGKLQVHDKLKDALAALLTSSHRDFVVMDGDRVVGTLVRDQLMRALASKGETAEVQECMSTELTLAGDTTPLENAYDMMTKAGSKVLIVKEHGALKGIVDSENILEFIMARQALAR